MGDGAQQGGGTIYVTWKHPHTEDVRIQTHSWPCQSPFFCCGSASSSSNGLISNQRQNLSYASSRCKFVNREIKSAVLNAVMLISCVRDNLVWNYRSVYLVCRSWKEKTMQIIRTSVEDQHVLLSPTIRAVAPTVAVWISNFLFFERGSTEILKPFNKTIILLGSCSGHHGHNTFLPLLQPYLSWTHSVYVSLSTWWHLTRKVQGRPYH